MAAEVGTSALHLGSYLVGLELSVTKNIVRQHGGGIEVRSEMRKMAL